LTDDWASIEGAKPTLTTTAVATRNLFTVGGYQLSYSGSPEPLRVDSYKLGRHQARLRFARSLMNVVLDYTRGRQFRALNLGVEFQFPLIVD
jgi:hypothetical protein